MKLSLRSLTPREQRTFKLHLAYSIIEGIIAGVLVLNEFVFIKSLLGSNYQLGLLFQFSMIVFLALIFINEFLKRIRNKKKLLRITAILTRAPLIFLLFFPRSAAGVAANPIYHYIFLAIFLIYYMASPVIYPAINLFLKQVYRHNIFGRLFSYATTVNRITIILATFFYGLWLDVDNYVFVYVLPAIAVLGIVSVHLFSMIDYKEPEHIPEKARFKEAVKKSAMNMFRIIKENVPYRHFEAGFMFYGFAFMITVTVITIYFERALHLNYSSVAFYKNGYNLLSILLLPFFGRLLDKIDPRKFATITFGAMLMYILFMTLTSYFPAFFEFKSIKIYYMLIFYIIFHGIFAATMSLLWFIGSAYFCKKEEAGIYQSVHLSLTGARALFAPLLGVLFYEFLGFTWTFVIAMVSLAIAIYIMYWSYNRERKQRANT